MMYTGDFLVSEDDFGATLVIEKRSIDLLHDIAKITKDDDLFEYYYSTGIFELYAIKFDYKSSDAVEIKFHFLRTDI